MIIAGIEFRPIPGYDQYFVSESGDIYSFTRTNPVKLKHKLNLQGYHQCAPSVNGRHKISMVHRLVALAWIGSAPDEKRICVHHIDHNKSNNHYSNLKWVSYSENIQYNYDTGGQVGKAGLEGCFGRDNPGSNLIRQFHPEDGLVGYYWGAAEAARMTGSNQAHIHEVCKRGRLKKHNGFIWRYAFK